MRSPPQVQRLDLALSHMGLGTSGARGTQIWSPQAHVGFVQGPVLDSKRPCGSGEQVSHSPFHSHLTLPFDDFHFSFPFLLPISLSHFPFAMARDPGPKPRGRAACAQWNPGPGSSRHSGPSSKSTNNKILRNLKYAHNFRPII